MTSNPGKLLAGINSPGDLKKLKPEELAQVADELREFILDMVSVHPGHLGASLGVIELAVALHYVFNTPYDRLIWDVGHQAYGHKILTGRRDVFHTNRQFKGISGFPSRAESEYDIFGTGHASTSVSAALGMAIAAKLSGENGRQHIAVIGDGAMTGGMAIEGLNNAGVSNTNLLVILNDNGIAIDKNVGLVKEYLARIAISKSFSNLFESIHFKYFGPVDGNDVRNLVKVLTELKSIEGPKLLHIITKKGKGFEKAEQEQTVYHAPGQFNRETGELISKKKALGIKTYQEVFGKSLLELARENPKIVAITPAMPTGSSLMEMMEEMPGRVFDVGIAEQHAVTFSAGLAASGFKPFCVVYSTFLQRAFDQVIHDVALQKLPVVFCIDRAGLVGEDGPTHHGNFDLAYMRMVPNMVVSAPMNELELRNMLNTAANYDKGPFSIRYPRGNGVGVDIHFPFEKIEIGKGRKLREGKKVAVVSIGHAGNLAAAAITKLEKENIFPGHFDIRFLKPLDEELLHHVFKNYSTVISLEDGCLKGGLADAISTFKNENNYQNHIKSLGIPDEFIEHGSQAELYKMCGFDVGSILNLIRSFFN